MCTVTYVPTANGFVFSSNRDEAPDRAAHSLLEEANGEQTLYYPQDEGAKGTWFAMSSDQRFACILNGAFVPHQRKERYRLSRGKMCLAFFASKNIDAFLSNFAFEGMEPFTFLVYQEGDFREIRWDEQQLHVTALDPAATHLWSSSTLYPLSWWKKRQEDFRIFTKKSPSQRQIVKYHKEELPFTPLALQQLYGTDSSFDDLPLATISVSSIAVDGPDWSLDFESIVHEVKHRKSFQVPYLRPMNAKVIAIDGYASTGKSTLSKLLAARLGYHYVDTGYMFRVVAHGMLENGIAIDYPDEKELAAFLSNCVFEWVPMEDGTTAMAAMGKVYGDEIRTAEVSAAVSPVATLAEVRTHLLEQQRRLAKNTSVVMDGRDIGTVVFPDAAHKFFLNADPKVRAKRRWEEMTQKGQTVDFEAVLQNVLDRDAMDSTRAIAPLQKAADAIEIDTTALSIDKALAALMASLGTA